MPISPTPELEWLTRKRRIDPRLDEAGWLLPNGPAIPLRSPFRSEEEPTDHGPADYALWLDNRIVGLVEGKKVTVGAQSVLTQAERYARGIRGGSYNFSGLRVPFLYATNGELLWFRDVRHPMNLSRRVAAFHTPEALRELLDTDFDAACERLRELPKLRPYQRDANAAVERAIAERRRELLVAMATGTGKTFTFVNQIYRLMKSGVARRVLFLVDRRILAAQAVRAFAAFEVEPGLKFDQAYEVYSSRFQREDFDENDAFDSKVLPNRYLAEPQPGDAFVYVCTIQRMAINVLGRDAVPGLPDERLDDDVGPLDIPIHAFDVIVADECHRGYTAQEQSVWRSTLDHFDAVKIGLTATPAAHTTAYFKHKVFEYSYTQAIRDGYLVDYDVVTIRSNIRLQGVFLREGETVEMVDPTTGLSRMDCLEDERAFDTTDVEASVTAPESNRKILEELKRYAEEHERQYGRFPKTLIFAVNDLPHTSHADQLVALARGALGRGEDFVGKITGQVDRPLQRIREFRNRPHPMVAVTVDLLSTGVDIPDLEFIVFLRPVKSRILFEQILGRGTRKGERFTDKSHFTVFDCFGGSLLEYFRQATAITSDLPEPAPRTIAEIVEDIWNNRDRDYNVRCLVKRLHRVDKEMAGEAHELFSVWIPDGDVGAFARALPRELQNRFSDTMKILRNERFQDLLVAYPRPPRSFLRAPEYQDEVSSEWLIRGTDGEEMKPEDFLEAFSEFVRKNEDQIYAIRILLDRPQEWSSSALSELRRTLAQSPRRFTVQNLQRAHERRYRKALVDIISMVKHAANDQAPLLTAAERAERAFTTITAGRIFTPEETQWLDRIREVLRENLSIERNDFESQPALLGAGGWGAARRAFGEQRLTALITHLNEAIAA